MPTPRPLRTALLLASLVAIPAAARADELGFATSAAPAPVRSGAVELGFGASYLHANGALTGASSTAVDTLGHEGVGLDLSAGLRLTPRWTVGAYGALGRFAADGGTGGASSWATALGVQGQFHFAPSDRIDPWAGLGAGWTASFVSQSAGTDVRHGFDLARLQLGVDWRVNSRLAVTPVVGATMSTLLTESLASGGGFHSVAETRVRAVVFGGVQGRFDLGGSGPLLVASR